MVYWGCSTARNRFMWGVLGACTATAVVLLSVGSSQLWHCNHSSTGGSSTRHPTADISACRVRAGILMALCPLLLLLGVLPSLLFFQSCLATQPPPPADWAVDVPASSITTVRWTPSGPAVCHYDAQGKLLQGPGCHRHTVGRTPPPPPPAVPKPSLPGPSGWASAGQLDTSQDLAAAAAAAAAAGACYSSEPLHLEAQELSRSSAGAAAGGCCPSPGHSLRGSQQLNSGSAAAAAAAAGAAAGGYYQSPANASQDFSRGSAGAAAGGCCQSSQQRGPARLTVSTNEALRSSRQYSPSSRQQYGSPAGRQYSPAGQQYSPSVQQLQAHNGHGQQCSGQHSADGQLGAGDGYICLSPLKQGANHLSSNCK